MMGLFRVQLLLRDNTWSTRYNKEKNDRCNDSSGDWTLCKLSLTVESYGINLIFDEIDTTHADKSFNIITKIHSVKLTAVKRPFSFQNK